MSVFSTSCCGRIIFKFIGPKQFPTHQEDGWLMLTWLQESSTMFVSSRTQRRALLHVEARGQLYQIKGV